MNQNRDETNERLRALCDSSAVRRLDVMIYIIRKEGHTVKGVLGSIALRDAVLNDEMDIRKCL